MRKSTKHNHTETAKRDSQTKLSSTFESANSSPKSQLMLSQFNSVGHPVIVFDASQRALPIVFLNEASIETFSLTAVQLKDYAAGKASWSSHFFGNEASERLVSSLKLNKPAFQDARLELDNKLSNYLIHVAPFGDSSSGSSLWFLQIHPLSELVANRGVCDRLVEESPELSHIMFGRLDFTGEMQFLSPRAAEVFWSSSKSRRNDALRKLWSYFEPGYAHSIMSAVRNIASGESSVEQLVAGCVTLGVGSRWYSMVLTRYDEAELITVEFFDVTSSREQEERLKFSNEVLERFAYAASHDLREPLRKVRMFSSNIQERIGDDLDEQSAYELDRLIDVGKRLSNMVDSLMELSQGARSVTKFEEVDVHELIEEVRDNLSVVIDANNASILNLAEVTVFSDRGALLSIFQNLFANSLQAAQTDVPMRIVVTTSSLNGYVLIAVSDNGVGIPEKDASEIFKPFSRGSQGAGKLGLGLSIARHLCESLGGGVNFVSNRNRGTTLVVKIPIKH